MIIVDKIKQEKFQQEQAISSQTNTENQTSTPESLLGEKNSRS